MERYSFNVSSRQAFFRRHIQHIEIRPNTKTHYCRLKKIKQGSQVMPKPVQEEIAELQQRLADLSNRSRRLEQQIQQEEQQVEAEELEGSVLRNCTTAQLRDMSQTLQELVTSENRTQISVSPPASTLR